MSTPKPKRRVAVGGKDHNIYRRGDGRFEVGYRDSTGRQRWRVDGFPSTFANISEARRARDAVLGRKAKGETVQPNPRLRFGDAADRWLAEQVADRREQTRNSYANSVNTHLRPRWGRRPLISITVNDAALLVRELRAAGSAESSIETVLRAGSRVFKFAKRRCGWHGDDPFALLEPGERARVSETPERRIYTPDELMQVIAASAEPWTTLFRLACVVGARESELLGLFWEDLDLDSAHDACIRFSHQVDRRGERAPLKTDEGKATLPLPRSTALMLLEHKARSTYTGAKSFVFSSRTGRALSQRNVLRALYATQERARKVDGTPTFPELFEHDDRGHLVRDKRRRYVPNGKRRRDLPPMPHFHSLRHTAAMDCDDAEEARDLLRHRNSNVTRAVYRAHFSDRRRDALRAKMEQRHGGTTAEATSHNGPHQPTTSEGTGVVSLAAVRDAGQ